MIDSAILLAAGLGTRLAPLSWVRAKAALPVAGEAIIRRQLRWLARYGVCRVVVNLHHLPATITSRIDHGDDFGIEVRFSFEPIILGSGGGPRRAFDLLAAERAYIVNSDTLTDLDLAALAGEHERHGALVTMASTLDRRTGYNALDLGPEGDFLGIVRADAPPGGPVARHVHFIGVQVAERRAFAAASPDEPSETLRTIYPALVAAREGRVRVWPTAVSFHDIGTPADYLNTVRTIAAAEGRALDRGTSVVVAESADLTGSVVWDDVQVGAGAVVHDSILADGVVVPAGRSYSRVAIVPRAVVPASAPGYADGSLWVTPLGPVD